MWKAAGLLKQDARNMINHTDKSMPAQNTFKNAKIKKKIQADEPFSRLKERGIAYKGTPT